jgi:hypothetical protein
MSRGLGAVERFVLKFLVIWSWMPTSAIVLDVARQRGVQVSPSLEASVRRALAALVRKGLVRQGTNKAWRSIESEKREEEYMREWRRQNGRRRRRRERREEEAREQSPTRVLSKLLGMLGSDHDGEVLTAARKAEAERRRLGKTWGDLL